jgi:hypothetical protein
MSIFYFFLTIFLCFTTPPWILWQWVLYPLIPFGAWIFSTLCNLIIASSLSPLDVWIFYVVSTIAVTSTIGGKEEGFPPCLPIKDLCTILVVYLVFDISSYTIVPHLWDYKKNIPRHFERISLWDYFRIYVITLQENVAFLTGKFYQKKSKCHHVPVDKSAILDPSILIRSFWWSFWLVFFIWFFNCLFY